MRLGVIFIRLFNCVYVINVTKSSIFIKMYLNIVLVGTRESNLLSGLLVKIMKMVLDAPLGVYFQILPPRVFSTC